jgi:hypothetical protein
MFNSRNQRGWVKTVGSSCSGHTWTVELFTDVDPVQKLVTQVQRFSIAETTEADSSLAFFEPPYGSKCLLSTEHITIPNASLSAFTSSLQNWVIATTLRNPEFMGEPRATIFVFAARYCQQNLPLVRDFQPIFVPTYCVHLLTN